MFSLTSQQRAVKDLLIARIARAGYAPSYREIADGIGVRSTAGVHRIIVALEQRGHIERIPGHARAIRIIGD